jgi:hypothetical protein
MSPRRKSQYCLDVLAVGLRSLSRGSSSAGHVVAIITSRGDAVADPTGLSARSPERHALGRSLTVEGSCSAVKSLRPLLPAEFQRSCRAFPRIASNTACRLFTSSRASALRFSRSALASELSPMER